MPAARPVKTCQRCTATSLGQRSTWSAGHGHAGVPAAGADPLAMIISFVTMPLGIALGSVPSRGEASDVDPRRAFNAARQGRDRALWARELQ
jgi:hypothetical protein